MEIRQAVMSPNEDCIFSDETWKVLVLCKNETYLLLLWTWTSRLCKCWTRVLPMSLGDLFFFFNINEKRKIFQSSVIPKFWTIYRTLIVLLRLQNVFLTSLDSSVKVHKVWIPTAMKWKYIGNTEKQNHHNTRRSQINTLKQMVLRVCMRKVSFSIRLLKAFPLNSR